MENRIREIVLEEVQRLCEREMKSSVDMSRVVSLASKCNFFLPYEMNSYSESYLVFYYGGKDYNGGLRNDFDRFADIISRCGWVINHWGNHYDGLRNMYKRFKDEHPEFGVGTFFACVEPEYGIKMDDHFGKEQHLLMNNDDENNIDNKGYWESGFNMFDEAHYGVTYNRGIFYHITKRKNLQPILRHGLKPKNGGGITKWRNSSPRIYLSLLPDFNDIDYNEYGDEEEYDDDNVILRIDLRGTMKNFDFYVDRSYPNAVFTYDNIPSQFIEVINNDEIADLRSRYYLRKAARESLKRIINHNFSNYDEDEKKRKVNVNSFEICAYVMPKVVLGYFKIYHIGDEYKKYIKQVCDNEVKNYLNS